ncbi:MAG TPA: hypothetical protein VHV28_13905 [Solirubrobacteraceae bacterium]|nr:hypothetical protein [Solirubrobacteraceae bacterium]
MIMTDPASSEQFSQQRAAQNEAVFRDANERIESRLNDLSLEAGRSPFLCECPDPACTVILRLTLTEYEQVREDGRCFVIMPDHGTRDGEVVRKEPTFWVVRKTGLGGRVAQRTDPRS